MGTLVLFGITAAVVLLVGDATASTGSGSGTEYEGLRVYLVPTPLRDTGIGAIVRGVLLIGAVIAILASIS